MPPRLTNARPSTDNWKSNKLQSETPATRRAVFIPVVLG
jgi:hypothetical protein